MREDNLNIADFLEDKKALFNELTVSIKSVARQDPGALREIMKNFRLVREELIDAGINELEKFLDEIEFSLDMITFTPGRDLMDALLAAEQFIVDYLTSISDEGSSPPDEGRQNDILATIMTSNPQLGGAGEGYSSNERLEEQQEARVTGEMAPEANAAVSSCSQEDNEILLDFLEESADNLSAAEVALMKLEEEPESKEYINEIFRCFHTIKGNSAFLNLGDVSELAHKSESLLDNARSGRISFEGTCATLSFASLDLLKDMIGRLRLAMTGSTYETPPGCHELIKKLEYYNQNLDALKSNPVKQERPSPESRIADEEGSDEHGGGKKSLDQKVKVSTTRMDNLIDAVGELVIATAMVFQEKEIQDTTNPKLARNVSHMGKIVRELQEMAMSLRMVSLKATFQKMTRIVRDLSVKTGVPVDFSFSGEDTELDRNVVEEIGNPLVHMVRNAVDHGIEPSAERLAKGKSGKGIVHLSGYQEGGSVVIKISDDGRGLNKEKILAKARNQGLIKNDAEVTEREIFNLIFQPGFSTADKVTDVSGRGVGMDVVKRNIGNLRGRIEIVSEEGKGTTFYIRLPLTLAIIDGVVVKISDEKFIIPTLSIIETIRAKEEQLSTVIGKGEIFNIRGELLPLFRLHRLFSLEGAKEKPTDGLIVVVNGDGGNCALLVDDLLGKQQVVIKSLDQTFKKLEGISGAAIMGDGRVALILDPQRISKMAQNVN
jgi:two-component system, chemotaxis family, sensor kinase CheA